MPYKVVQLHFGAQYLGRKATPVSAHAPATHSRAHSVTQSLLTLSPSHSLTLSLLPHALAHSLQVTHSLSSLPCLSASHTLAVDVRSPSLSKFHLHLFTASNSHSLWSSSSQPRCSLTIRESHLLHLPPLAPPARTRKVRIDGVCVSSSPSYSVGHSIDAAEARAGCSSFVWCVFCVVCFAVLCVLLCFAGGACFRVFVVPFSVCVCCLRVRVCACSETSFFLTKLISWTG